MSFTLSNPTHNHARRSLRSANGGAWRIKPEVRTLSQIIVEQQLLEALNVTREWVRITRGVNLSNPF
jgi:hypothetical protein